MSTEKSLARDFTKDSVFRLLIIFSIPIMLANSLQIVYNIVDMAVVGNFLGTNGVSAVSAGSDMLMFFTTFSIGICSAGQVIISQFLGKNEANAINKTIGTMFSFIISFAFILMVIGLVFADWLLEIINTPIEAFSQARDYLTVCFIGLPFIFGYNAVSAMLRGMGDSKHPLLFVGIATVVNLVLDVIFVGPFKMDTLGAALATVVGQASSFVFSLFFLYKKRTEFGFDFKPSSFKPDISILKMFIKLGIPMALQHAIVNISTLYVSASVNAYGVVVSSLSGIGNKFRMVSAIVTSSVGTAAASMVGQNTAAREFDRVKQIFWYSLVILVVLNLILGGAGILFPKALVGMFDTNSEVLAMAPRYMYINLAICLVMALYQPGTSLINGIGNASFAFIMGIIDGLICRVGSIWFINKFTDFGYWGVWWASPLASYVGVIILFVYFFSGKWKKRSLIVNNAKS